MDEENYKNQKIVFLIFFIIVIGIILIVATRLKLKEVKEQEISPFQIGQIAIFSMVTADENGTQEKNYWNWDLNQVNDIYLTIFNKERNTDIYLQKLYIDNIKLLKQPLHGEVYFYRTSLSEDKYFENTDEYLIIDNLEYIVVESSPNNRALEIAREGGMIEFRVSNENVAKYVTLPDEKEINIDGTLLKKAKLIKEDIDMKLSFDISIVVNDKLYITNIKIDLPTGNVLESELELTERLPLKGFELKLK